jgi:phosphatidylserine decarboxylase
MQPNDLPTATAGDRAFALLQLLLPTRLISWLVFKLTRVTAPGFKNAFIEAFVRAYRIDMAQAEHPRAQDYRHFNAFFTRALKPGARPLPADPQAIASPVDGTVSQLGPIDGDRLFQAKGHHYTIEQLLGDAELARPFIGGSFCTIYLAPYNYHRIHMPLGARLREWLLVPGRLFSVNAATARALRGVFARNERVVAMFDASFGPLALVLVGALNVGSMETVWAGQITPPHRRRGILRWTAQAPLRLERGAEMGRFNMGSTVILLAPAGAVAFDPALKHGSTVVMGQSIGRVL